MGDNTYPASVAILFIAIGRLQRKAHRAKTLFVEDRLMRAADAALIQDRGNGHYPDLPERIAEREVSLAVSTTKGEAAGLVALLVRAGEDLIARAIANTRRTVRRRYDMQCALPPEGLRDRECRADVDDRLDFEELVQRVSRLHKEVLLRRARGENDREIAAALKLHHKHVPVLVHRAIISLRRILAKPPVQTVLAAG
jgi:FixJ family two-component response regulator